MSDDKAGFATRLRAAMRAKGWEERPRELVARFNARYRGPSVSSQAISGWLGGKSRPRDDKLMTLAQVLGVKPDYLLFGGRDHGGVREVPPDWPPPANAHDRGTIIEFLSLSTDDRKLVRELIERLHKSGHK